MDGAAYLDIRLHNEDREWFSHNFVPNVADYPLGVFAVSPEDVE